MPLLPAPIVVTADCLEKIYRADGDWSDEERSEMWRALGQRAGGLRNPWLPLLNLFQEELLYATNRAEPTTEGASRITAYLRALGAGANLLKRYGLSPEFLRALHGILLSGGAAGGTAFRKKAALVAQPHAPVETAALMPPQASDVPQMMSHAFAALEPMLRKHPVRATGRLYGAIIMIHPFLDGNGRTARTLVPMALQHARITQFPLAWISSTYHRHAGMQAEALRSSERQQDYTPWDNYFGFLLDASQKKITRLVDDVLKIQEEENSALKERGLQGNPISDAILSSLHALPEWSLSVLSRELGVTTLGMRTTIDALERVGVIEYDGKIQHRRVYRMAYTIIESQE